MDGMTPLIPLLLALTAAPPAAQAAPPPAGQPVSSIAPAAAGPAYADLVDLALAAPVIADATIRSATRIKPAEAPGLPANAARFYVEADVGALVRGRGGLASRIGYLVDRPLDARGRAPKLKKQRVLLFARPVAGAPAATAQVQLAAPDAQLDWTPALDAAVRRVATQLAAADAPPRVTGVGNAFHVPGALPGEGETQVFLQTEGGRPVSLSVLRRPGEQPRFAVALSEIVDDAAAAPTRDTLLWYRLACGLPPALPEAATRQLSADDRTAAERDYQFVSRSLGPCGRTRGPAAGSVDAQ